MNTAFRSHSARSPAPPIGGWDFLRPQPCHATRPTDPPARTRRQRVIAAIVLCCLTVASAASARTLYVSPKGSDSGDGSSSRPFLTSQKALRVAVDGDRVLFGAGHFPKGLTLTRHVSLGAWQAPATLGTAVPVVSAGSDQSRPIWGPNVGRPLAMAESQSQAGTSASAALAPPGDHSTESCGTVLLRGAIADADGTAQVTWSVVSGPGELAFREPRAATTLAEFNGLGRYVVRLTARNGPYVATDEMVLVSYSSDACAPSPPGIDANAGSDQLLTNQLSTTLRGRVRRTGAASTTPITSTWSRVSGPGQAFFGSPNSTNTEVTVTSLGTYVFRLSAVAGSARDADDVQVTFESIPAMVPPVVVVPPVPEVTLPETPTLVAVVLYNGSTELPPGTKLLWERISGPPGVRFNLPNQLRSTVSFTSEGSYVLRLTATIGGLTGSDKTTVTVRRREVTPPPVVTAEVPPFVDFPGPALLGGTVTQGGAAVAPGKFTAQWTSVVGPGTVVFSPPSQISATAVFSQPGTYRLRLRAWVGSAEGADSRSIEVRDARYYLDTYEDPTRSCGLGNPILIRNRHTTRSIAYTLELRLQSLFKGEFTQILTGLLHPGEPREFACSDRSVGPGLGYVSHQITAASFAPAGGTSSFAAPGSPDRPGGTAEVQSVEAAALEVRRSPSSEILVSWSAGIVGVVLESAEVSASPLTWKSVTEPTTLVDDRNMVRIPSAGTARLFRLSRP